MIIKIITLLPTFYSCSRSIFINFEQLSILGKTLKSVGNGLFILVYGGHKNRLIFVSIQDMIHRKYLYFILYRHYFKKYLLICFI